MAEDFKGDLYYIDPAGSQWKITRKIAERSDQRYWHADVMNQSDNKAHRVSASMHRLLSGIDANAKGENHDGGPQENRTKDCLHPQHPEACKYPTETRHFA